MAPSSETDALFAPDSEARGMGTIHDRMGLRALGQLCTTLMKACRPDPRVTPDHVYIGMFDALYLWNNSNPQQTRRLYYLVQWLMRSLRLPGRVRGISATRTQLAEQTMSTMLHPVHLRLQYEHLVCLDPRLFVFIAPRPNPPAPSPRQATLSAESWRHRRG